MLASPDSVSGQRVTFSNHGQSAPGSVVAYVMAIGDVGGVYPRIVVQLDSGSFVFADPSAVRVQASEALHLVQAPPANRQPQRQQSPKPQCPRHHRSVASKRADGEFYCPVQDDLGYCSWTWPSNGVGAASSSRAHR